MLHIPDRADARPSFSARRLAAALASLGLLTVVATAASGGIATSLPPAATPSASATGTVQVGHAMTAEQIAAGHGCPVTGDLVWSPEGTNEGNPATVAQTLCGR